jgi:DNA-binding transcriptional MocR family regulator
MRPSETAIPSGISGRTSRELVDSIEGAIHRGDLAPGARLPSVRTFARAVGVSHTTVAGALGELRRRGVIVTEERRRTRVATSPPLAMSMAPPAPPAGVRDVRHGGPDRAQLPDIRPALHRAAEEVVAPRLYGLPQVDSDLGQTAVASFHATGVDGQWVAVCGGALDAIQRALESALRPGDAIAVEDPGYADLFDLARSLGLRLLPVAVDSEGPAPAGLADALAAGARAVVITPVGQNPLGAAVTQARARELNELLHRNRSTLLIEDQHLGAIAPTPVTSTSGLERWLVVRTLAKAYGPDLRIALAAGDATTIARIRGRIAVGPGWISHLLQRTAVHLLRDDELSRDLAGAGETYARRRTALLAALAERGVVGVGASGLNVWVPVADETTVTMALASAGWAVAPGAPFRLASGPAVRLTASTLTEDDIPALAEATAGALSVRRARGG